MTWKYAWPIKIGSLAKTNPIRLSQKAAAEIITHTNHEQLTLSCDHHLDVWLERLGDAIPEDWVGNYDTSRHSLDLEKQIEGDLLTRKKELMPTRVSLPRL